MEEQDDMKDAVVALHCKGDWKGVVQLYESHLLSTDRILLWFQPDFQALDFLHRNLYSMGVSGVSSIGCGTGLLEWLINQSTGLPVIGYEIDAGWWDSKYSPPKFLSDVVCIGPSVIPQLDPNYALLFCYFNNLPAFEIYLKQFFGHYVILIGPNKRGTGRFCDPEPFHLQDHPDWIIHSSWSSPDDDAIVIYQNSKL